MVFGLASCNKEESGSGAGASTNGSLVGTQWVASDGEAQITLIFATASEAEIDVVTPRETEHYRASYTYTNGNGTMSLSTYDTTYSITFTVSGNTLTAQGTPDGDVVFTRTNGGQQPGPNPGGDLRNSLVGTGWMYSNNDVFVVVEFCPNSQVGIVVSPKNGGEDMTYYGSYTYNNFNGSISINVEGQDYTIRFVVNGEMMSATGTPVGDIMLTLMTN